MVHPTNVVVTNLYDMLILSHQLLQNLVFNRLSFLPTIERRHLGLAKFQLTTTTPMAVLVAGRIDGICLASGRYLRHLH